MSFKEEIEQDLEQFFECDEFEAEHRVEGKLIRCVVENNQTKAGAGETYGLAEADYIIHAKTKDLPARKAAGSLLNLDGRELTVAAWDEQDGASVVSLFTPETV